MGKFLIISEVSEVMRETTAAIEGRVKFTARQALFHSLARTAARAKVVKAAPRASAASALARRALAPLN